MRRTERLSAYSVSLLLLGLSVGTAPLLGRVASSRPDAAMLLGIAAATFLIMAVRSLWLGRDTNRPALRWRRTMGAALILAGMAQVAAVRISSPPTTAQYSCASARQRAHRMVVVRSAPELPPGHPAVQLTHGPCPYRH
jgi:hypothetical protein